MPQFLPWENADELLWEIIRNGVSNSILVSKDLVTIGEMLTNSPMTFLFEYYPAVPLPWVCLTENPPQFSEVILTAKQSYVPGY